jgi:predicted nucleotidyltransferase
VIGITGGAGVPRGNGVASPQFHRLPLYSSPRADLQILVSPIVLKEKDHIFGSVACDQAHPERDVDILVELDESIGFFEFFQIEYYLEDLL